MLHLLAGRSRSSGQQLEITAIPTVDLDRWHQKTIGACRTKQPSAGKTAYWHERSKVRLYRVFLYSLINVRLLQALSSGDHRRGNDFPVGESKIGEKQSRQSNSKYNFMQYAFFEKVGYTQCRPVQRGLGQRLGEFLRIFVLKVTLRLLLTQKFSKIPRSL